MRACSSIMYSPISPACHEVPHADDDEPLDLAHLLERQVQAAEVGEALLGVEAAAHRVPHRVRLLEDLLQHEVVVAALLDLGEVPVDFVNRLVDAFVRDRRGVEAVGRQHRHLAVVEVHHLARVLDDRRHVGGQEVLAVGDAHDQRAAVARADHRAGFVGAKSPRCRTCPRPRSARRRPRARATGRAPGVSRSGAPAPRCRSRS